MNRILLLQGPMGPFFTRYRNYLRSRGARVWKINFNGGDWLNYHGADVINYRGTMEAWPQFLSQTLKAHRITRIVLFGDCRWYHQEAVKIAQDAGIRISVFEEGYIRPDFITFEEGGVNGFSSLPRDPGFYTKRFLAPKEAKVLPAGTRFRRMALSAMAYYLASTCLRPYFWHYQHHKSFSIWRQSAIWLRSGFRKLLYRRGDQRLTAQLASHLSKRYFLVPLQVHNDSQVTLHSAYPDITEFIREVIASFATHAPKDRLLILKHHPMDRGARHYGRLINELRNRYGLGGRLLYTHEIHLPTALAHARGVVVINSTVGLSALLHKAPVKTMGNAIYDISGLTCQKSLQKFWTTPGKVSGSLLQAFRRHVIATTQINGSFYGLNPFPINVKEAAPLPEQISVMQMEDA